MAKYKREYRQPGHTRADARRIKQSDTVTTHFTP